jgi:hypothetical protein
MTKARTYQCDGNPSHRNPVLRAPHQFTYLHHPTVDADPVPRYCPKCGFDSEDEEPTEAITSPHIALSIKGVVDNMHKEMEAGADFRAAMARDQFGLDAEDVAPMKFGDMKDGLRPGDTSDVPVQNDISRLMTAAPPGMFGFQGGQGVGYSGPVSEGPFPNMGARTQKEVREAHVANTADPRHVGHKTSSVPALETTQPGYRVRVR